MTNLEWVRTLSAGDLAKLFWNRCEVCAYHDNCELESGDDSECPEGILKWLEQKHREEIKLCSVCGNKMDIRWKHSGCYLTCSDCGYIEEMRDECQDENMGMK